MTPEDVPVEKNKVLSPCPEGEEDNEEAAAAKVFHSRLEENSGTLWHQV